MGAKSKNACFGLQAVKGSSLEATALTLTLAMG